MKRKKNEKLILKVETVRSLKDIRPIEDAQLGNVVGGAGYIRTTSNGCTGC